MKEVKESVKSQKKFLMSYNVFKLTNRKPQGKIENWFLQILTLTCTWKLKLNL